MKLLFNKISGEVFGVYIYGLYVVDLIQEVVNVVVWCQSVCQFVIEVYIYLIFSEVVEVVYK